MARITENARRHNVGHGEPTEDKVRLRRKPDDLEVPFDLDGPAWSAALELGPASTITKFIEGPFAETFRRFVAEEADLRPSALRRTREQLSGLDRQQLSELRSLLIRSAGRGPARHGALRGPPTIQKVMQILVGAPWSPRLDPVTRRFLRAARDQNVDALMARGALDLVNKNDGYYKKLNPSMETLDIVGVSVKNVEQRYLLIDLVRDLLQVGFGPSEIDDMVQAAAKSPPEVAVAGFLAAGRMRVAHRKRICDAMTIPEGMGEVEITEVQNRLSRARWVESALMKVDPTFVERPESFRDDLGALFTNATSPTGIYEALDQRFEAAMTTALDNDLAIGPLTHLKTVAFERRAPDLAQRFDTSDQQLPADHSVRTRLAELERRLAAGERSAVGGADYATQTFPEEILEAAAAGQLTVVAFDGDREAGIDYIRDTYGVEGVKRQGCRIMGLQGIYGSYPRSLVTLDDGSQFLLVSGFGECRQLNNAAMLQLFKGRGGAQIEADDIDLATDGGDRVAQFAADIERAIDTDAERRTGDILGVRVDDPTEIPTRLMIIQNPQHLSFALPERIEWGEDLEGTLVPMKLAYVKKDDGTLERVIVPKVGGGGVYGDTAGHFVSAFFSTTKTPLVDDVIFNGATGGFADTEQLPDVDPGGYIAPTVSVEEYGYGEGRMSLPTLLAGPRGAWNEHVRAAFERAGAHATEHHVAIGAPSIETFALIHELVAAGFASIDVEAGAVLRAVTKLRAGGRPVTFTPLYTHSDDPRHSEHDRFDSLAMMGPLFEGSKFDAPLFDILLALAGWSDSAGH